MLRKWRIKRLELRLVCLEEKVRQTERMIKQAAEYPGTWPEYVVNTSGEIAKIKLKIKMLEGEQ